MTELVSNLRTISKETSHPRKDVFFKQTLNFMNNLIRFDLDTDLIVKMKVGRYLSVMHSLLLDINQPNNHEFSLLLSSITILITKIRSRLMTMVILILLVLLKRQTNFSFV